MQTSIPHPNKLRIHNISKSYIWGTSAVLIQDNLDKETLVNNISASDL